MENDIIFRILTEIPYPLIYRHDRKLYQTFSQIDPIQLIKKSMLAAFAGYWIGKFSRRRQKIFAFAFPLPFILKYLYDEKNLSQQVKKYEEFSISSSSINIQKKQPNNSQKDALKQTRKQYTHRVVRSMPRFDQKIYNASDFVDNLSKDYFK